MRALLIIGAIIFLVVILICMIKTVEFFNIIPERNKYKSVLAWDVLILFMVIVALIIKIIKI